MRLKYFSEFLNEKQNFDNISLDKEFPIINKNIINGLTIKNEIPNMSSIGASLTNYEILKGIREVSFNSFPQMGELTYYSTSEEQYTKKLAKQIEFNKEITPLIVVIDDEGAYILEGVHRFDALRELDIPSFPAKVVLDLDSKNVNFIENVNEELTHLPPPSDNETDEMLNESSPNQALLKSAKINYLPGVIKAIERGAYVNVRLRSDSFKKFAGQDITWDLLCTPLIFATKNNNLEMVKYLIENKANVKLKDYLGRSALHYGARDGNLKIVKYLVEHGANILDEANDGRNAYQYTGWGDIREYFIEILNKRNLNESLKYLPLPSDDETDEEFNKLHPREALAKSISNNYLRGVEKAIERGADVNFPNQGHTFLVTAILNNNFDIIKCLVEHGADVNKRDSYPYKTPLMYAAHRGYFDIVKYLVENGADKNMVDSYNITAYNYANSNGQPEIAKFLKNKHKRLKNNLKNLFGENRLYNFNEFLNEELLN